MFNPFKCRHKRTYRVSNEMDDGTWVFNHFCRKCDKSLEVTTSDNYVSLNGARRLTLEIDTNPRTNPRIETTSANDDKETYKGEDIAKLRHQGMLLEKVPEKYITVTLGTYDARINRCYL